MPTPSYYFTLFKKFQVIGHANDGSVHGAPGGFHGFTVATPSDFTSNKGALLGATPATSPLWAMLNARAMGLGSVVVGGTPWTAMPIGSPPGWSDFQTAAPAPKLVPAFGDWINAG